MPSNPVVTVLAANAEANAVGALLNGGYVRLYDVAGTVLATQRFPTPAFRDSVDGLIESFPLVPDLNTAGGGDAVRLMCQTLSGQNVFGGSVGVADADFILDNSTTIHPGGECHISTVYYQSAVLP